MPWDSAWDLKAIQIGTRRLHQATQLTTYNSSASLNSYLLDKVQICEILIKTPHKNIALYLSCVVKTNWITRLYFQNYVETLSNRLQARHLVDNKRCFQQVKEGIYHLYTLSLVYINISLNNVMFVGTNHMYICVNPIRIPLLFLSIIFQYLAYIFILLLYQIPQKTIRSSFLISHSHYITKSNQQSLPWYNTIIP